MVTHSRFGLVETKNASIYNSKWTVDTQKMSHDQTILFLPQVRLYDTWRVESTLGGTPHAHASFYCCLF